MDKLQLTLDSNCSELDQELYSAYSVPYVIEDSAYYQRIRDQHAGTLHPSGYSVLSSLRKVVANQQSVQCAGDGYLVYLAGTNSVCTSYRASANAEEFFEKYTNFSESDTEAILNYFKTKGCIKLLPMKKIWLNAETTETERMLLIVRPKDSRIAVMSMYSREQILNLLGYPLLPEGTLVEIRDGEGALLMQHPAALEETEGYHVLKSRMPRVGATVSVRIPEQYFKEQVAPVSRVGSLALVMVSVLGLIMALVFSGSSVAPLRKLVLSHEGRTDGRPVNEIRKLDQLLTTAQRKNTEIQQKLIRQLLARALSGAVLSVEEEQLLTQNMPLLGRDYRVAILHAGENLNGILGEYLEQSVHSAVWTILNIRETGLILADREEAVLKELVEQMNREHAAVFCGVSTLSRGIGSLHKLVQQARAAIPQEGGFNCFPEGPAEVQTISWQQHERLYQMIFAGKEAESENLLLEIAANVNSSNARLMFYNLCFVMSSAAENLELPQPWDTMPEYMPSRLPKENIRRLTEALQVLLASIAEKNRGKQDSRLTAILRYMEEHMSDCEMCIGTVAKQFGISERRLYEIIQKQGEMSFNEYLISMRMKRAASLLLNSNLKVSEVGAQCGYRISSTFYRLFKSHYGVAPGEYRTAVEKKAKTAESAVSPHRRM